MKLTFSTKKGEYTGEYSQSDYGTERLLTVKSPSGDTIGRVDPFWPSGVPVSQSRFNKRLVECCKNIIRQHAYNTFTNLAPFNR